MIFFAAIPFAAFSLYIPAFPEIAKELAVSKEAVAATVMASMISFPIASIFMGPLSDALGRKPMLIMAFSAFIIGSIICMLANCTEMLFIGRAFQGMGGAGTAVLSRAMCRDFMDDSIFMDAVGWLGVVLGMIPLFAPAIGGFITNHFGWRTNFIMLLICGIIAMGMVLFMTRETHHQSKRIALDIKLFAKEYYRLITSKDYLFVMLMPALFFIFLGINVTLISFYLHDKGFSITQIGIAQGVTAITMIVGRTVTISLLKRKVAELSLYITSAWIMLLGGVIALVAFFLLDTSVWWVLGAMSVINLSAGLNAPIVNKNTMAVMPWIPGISSSLTVAAMVLLEALGCGIATNLSYLKISPDHILPGSIIVLAIYTLITAYLSRRVIIKYTSKRV